jgi:hypothetical protein
MISRSFKGVIQAERSGYQTLRVNIFSNQLGSKMTCGHLFVFGWMAQLILFV